RGRLVIVGAVPIEFPWHRMYMKEVRLVMSRAYGPGSYDPVYEKEGRDYPIPYVRWTENRNMAEFLRLVRQGQVDVSPLITHEFAVDHAATAYQTVLDSASGSLAVLLRYASAENPAAAVGFTPRRRVDLATKPHETGALRVAIAGAGNLARWVHLPTL